MTFLRCQTQHLLPSMLKRGFNGAFTGLHGFRSLILYSTSAASKDRIPNPPPIIEFLTKSVGFSEEEAASIVTKVSVFPKRTPKQPELVVDFLKRSGFDETHIRRLLTSIPKVLSFKIDKTLAPKIRAFEELGLRGSDLGSVISQHPHLLRSSLKANVIPSLETLKSVIGSTEQLISFLLKTKSSKLLSYSFIKNLPQNMLLLQSYGVPSGKIKQLMLQRPQMLIHKTQWFEEQVKAVEEKLGIPPTSTMFLHAVSALSMISEDKLESRVQVFRSYGWSETEISTVLRRHPLIFNLSEKLLRARLKYFMEELGYGSDYLVSRPAILSYSMEKRIMPRTAVIQALKEKQLLKKNLSLYTLMNYATSKFVQRYVVPFKDELPQLYKDYMQQTSSSVQHKKRTPRIPNTKARLSRGH